MTCADSPPLLVPIRWAEGELREVQVRLELTLAACTGAYKSALWVRRLEQLKRRWVLMPV